MIVKIDNKKRKELWNIVKDVNKSTTEYIKVLNDFGYEYSENLDDVLYQYGCDVYDEMLKNDKSLILRVKGAIDKLLFKDKIIREQELNTNERLTTTFQQHKTDLDKIRQYISGFNVKTDYIIECYVFEGSKVHKLFVKYINHWKVHNEMNDLLTTEHMFIQERRFIIPNHFGQYVAFSPYMTEPVITFNEVRFDDDWCKLIETLEIKKLI